MPLPTSAQKILARIAVDDGAIADAARRRAAESQELTRQEFEAVQEFQRLAKADKDSRLVREDRQTDGDGNISVVKERDTARLGAASEAVDAIRERKALLAATTALPRLTAARIERELEQFKGKKLVAVERPPVVLGKSERTVDALDRLRAETLDLIAERTAVAKAPHTAAEVKAAAHGEIDKLADRLPRTFAMFHGASITWPQHEIHAARTRVPDALAVVAFLMRDQLKREISKLIDFNAGAFPEAMSREDQAERLAKLESEIEVAERLEAAAVETVIAEGGVGHHRPDCSVLAVLSLRVE
ncbi:hypothetical protein IVB14_29595 [Bradyrhizobium sp. 180]|uniref:hypothetical protein n=1 Tax=unclassified Bradyrhizobium TaxID=2631580 RepID=UPI001FFB7687|nr:MULTISPECIES: hypothetical protein [unclassified Bradyrhizobium]MCK1494451.1 hypothetical protein [Bradyrhizobium sp. 180]MCK1593786.1 hypothetical protein [Bradyrhizobium sp. 164]